MSNPVDPSARLPSTAQPPANAMGRRLTLGVVEDFREENWVSMDFCAEMLLRQCRTSFSAIVDARPICAPFRRIATAPTATRSNRRALNADRLVNRYWRYPAYLRRHARGCDRYHIVDHSYAHLIRALPGAITGMCCHDIDPFRCLVTPQHYPASRLLRGLMRRVLDGMQRAALVFYAANAVRDELIQYQLVDPQRLVFAPLGAALEFHYAAERPTISDVTGLPEETPYLLHVGSCVPRKRIDVLLETFARVRAQHPALRLVKVGGEWSSEQAELLDRLHLRDAVIHLIGVARIDLTRLYRRAAVVLFPSDREGFGLPVIEALACGASVVASDIPVLHEVGGAAVNFCPVADLDRWADAVDRILRDPGSAPPLEARLQQAAQFSWQRQAAIILEAYRALPG